MLPQFLTSSVTLLTCCSTNVQSEEASQQQAAAPGCWETPRCGRGERRRGATREAPAAGGRRAGRGRKAGLRAGRLSRGGSRTWGRGRAATGAGDSWEPLDGGCLRAAASRGSRRRRSSGRGGACSPLSTQVPSVRCVQEPSNTTFLTL